MQTQVRAVAMSWAVVFLVVGCVTTKEEGDILRRDVRGLQEKLSAQQEGDRARVTDMEARLRVTEEHIKALEGTTKNMDETTSRGRADLGASVQELQQEFARLKGQLEAKENQIKERELQLGASQEQVKQLEVRLIQMETLMKEMQDRMTATSAAAAAAQMQLKIQATQAAAAPAGESAPAAAASHRKLPKDRKDLYEVGKKAHDDGDFALCLDALDTYVTRYPKDKELLDNAWFWTGECQFKDKHYDKAILAYQKVITDHPQSEKADASLYKMGIAFAELGYKDDAKVFFEDLLQKFPKSSLARDAKKRLDALSKPPPRKRSSKRGRRR